jgi:hypothetical protein
MLIFSFFPSLLASVEEGSSNHRLHRHIPLRGLYSSHSSTYPNLNRFQLLFTGQTTKYTMKQVTGLKRKNQEMSFRWIYLEGRLLIIRFWNEDMPKHEVVTKYRQREGKGPCILFGTRWGGIIIFMLWLPWYSADRRHSRHGDTTENPYSASLYSLNFHDSKHSLWKQRKEVM